MGKNKRKSAALPAKSKNEQLVAQMEKQKKKTLIVIVATIVLVAVIFAGLFMLANKDSSTAGTAAEPVEFNYSTLTRLGSEDAPVKIVEFGDYKCPACAQFAGVIKPQLVQEYVNQDKAALYFVNLAFLGPDSTTAALAALSVYNQNSDAFWKYYDAIYANQGDENKEWATADFLVELAQKENLQIDYDLLRKDIEEKTYKSQIDSEIQLATASGVSSTPSLFVNGVMVDEPFNMEAIDAQIQAASKAVSAE
ncbi:disulfide dehydrogenase [Paenibacillus sp. FSL R7-0273]|uniref:thioredoxin domain-containing protein n=1 Tax=Paenibacillus sp. FSL R7-0273 TaxID=1536772 RepID=UPI0004F87AF8|nr:thioredoxin domain-containing protein [Paenibacillus sp. FSL R7-0273]AIQ47516.1 disulfide dehydrogenase [Paenibacillus sp. FSL R7-0273]OMF95925.1 disulfide dehydrogenase [Paenibacillus sp. FSL R7-0273]